MTDKDNDPPVRDAATVVLVRQSGEGPRILMGQRGAKAAFMANKFVFPGGAVDAEDRGLPGGAALRPETAEALATDNAGAAPDALVNAAIRELWEETGLALAQPGTTEAVPDGWQNFYDQGYHPARDRLSFFFRAVTPPGRPRRFDARFFVAGVEALSNDPDDFSRASGELSHLQWVPLDGARSLPLPFVTELVLAEVVAMLGDLHAPRTIPYFHQGVDGPQYKAILPEGAVLP